GPAVIDDVADREALGAQLVALGDQGGLRVSLEGEMVEGGRNAQPAINAGIVVRRHARYVARFHERQKLIASDVEEDMSQPTTLADERRVGNRRLEAENVLVEGTCPVEIESSEPDMGKTVVAHAKSLLFACCRSPVAVRREAECRLSRLRSLATAS